MNGRIFITTTKQSRRAHWERIFATDQLPVLTDEPRVQMVNGRMAEAYDLDLKALHHGQINRLAAHFARKSGKQYPDALAAVQAATSYPIEATNDVKIIEVEAPTLQPHFDQAWPPWLRVPHQPLVSPI